MGALVALVLVWPLIAVSALVIWLQDFRNPFYISFRIGRGARPFKLCKLRTMTVGADSTGPMTASTKDPRVTSFGRFLRRSKIDELPQFFNVLIGQMSLVGPRPQVPGEVETYTLEERKLLRVQPGLSDYSSIVFSDLGEIVRTADDTHLAYQQLVRPWKSRLGLFYIANQSFGTDVGILIATAVSIVSHRMGRHIVVAMLRMQDAPDDLVQVATRTSQLRPAPPPGSNKIIGS